MINAEKLDKAMQEAKNRYYDEEFVINYEIVQQVKRLGYPLEYVIKCLEDNDTNHCTTTYYLIADDQTSIA